MPGLIYVFIFIYTDIFMDTYGAGKSEHGILCVEGLADSFACLLRMLRKHSFVLELWLRNMQIGAQGAIRKAAGPQSEAHSPQQPHFPRCRI